MLNSTMRPTGMERDDACADPGPELAANCSLRRQEEQHCSSSKISTSLLQSSSDKRTKSIRPWLHNAGTAAASEKRDSCCKALDIASHSHRVIDSLYAGNPSSLKIGREPHACSDWIRAIEPNDLIGVA